MSKIEELIAELCPQGVGMENLGSLAKTVRAPRSIPRSQYLDSGILPVIDQSQLPIAGYVNDLDAALDIGACVVFGDHTREVKFVDYPFAAGADGTVILSPGTALIPRYLYFVMAALQITSRGYNRHWSAVKNIEVPIPPLEVQREIVSILDKFTQLEAELEAELDARRSQLEAIRDSTLFEKNITWPEVSLGEVADLVTQRARADGRRVYVGVENLAKDKRGLDRLDLEASQDEGRAFESMDVLLGNIRPYLRKVWHADKSGITNGDVVVLRPRDQQEMSSEFLMQVVSSERFFQHFIANSKGAKMPRGDKGSLLKFIFRLPPISRQLELCNPLRDLSSLTISQIDGIPAEITARRKQYEYYRNQLLTFKELETA